MSIGAGGQGPCKSRETQISVQSVYFKNRDSALVRSPFSPPGQFSSRVLFA